MSGYQMNPRVAVAIKDRVSFRHADLISYHTRGGTYMLATPALYNDDDQTHDLIAIDSWGGVHAVRPTTNPDLVKAVEEALQ